MLRRLSKEQPESFAFTPGNLAWAEKQLAKYPAERKASAIIPLLWRAQEQEGWLTRKAIETVAEMLDMAYIRALEVATFYFMFQLHPVGTVAHVQVCGTTSCMICGAEDLISVCKARIAPKAHQISECGRFSWEEVECLGACSNAPMVQIGKDFYEDLTEASFTAILDAFARGETPKPGPQNGRFAAEPKGGPTALIIPEDEREPANGSVAIALEMGDTAARIIGEGKEGVDASNITGGPSLKPAPAPKAEAAPAPAAAPASAPAAAPQADAELGAAHAAAEAEAARKAAIAAAVDETKAAQTGAGPDAKDE